MNNSSFKIWFGQVTFMFLSILIFGTLPAVSSADTGARTVHNSSSLVKDSQIIPIVLSDSLTLTIIMPLRNLDELIKKAHDFNDAQNPATFGKFYTHEEFKSHHAPLDTDVADVINYLNLKGFTIIKKSDFRIKFTGTVGNIQQTFKVILNHIQNSDKSECYSPASDAIIDETIADKAVTIVGLDTCMKVIPRIQPQAISNTASPQIGIGSGPSRGLTPEDTKIAYSLSKIYPISHTSSKSGQLVAGSQNVALIEFDGFYVSDITKFEKYFNLANVPLKVKLQTDSQGNPLTTGSPVTSKGQQEATADIEQLEAYTTTRDPGINGGAPTSVLSQIVVYEAGGGTQADWADEFEQIAEDDVANVVSCSYGFPGPSGVQDPLFIFDQFVFLEMSAQGQSIFVAAGDHGAYNNGTNLLGEPLNQQNITVVGISALAVNSDYTWANEFASAYGGGGISGFVSIPVYQKEILNRSLILNESIINLSNFTPNQGRNIPDVVLNADPSASYAIYVTNPNFGLNGWIPESGSSLSTPVWAAFMALVNQGRASAGKPPLGFLNPALYQIAESNNYPNDFHDIKKGSNSFAGQPGFEAETGFDDATGLGSFNAKNLYEDLLAFNVLTPTVSITSPAEGSSFIAGSNIKIIANASEVNGTIAQVNFFNEGILLGTSTTPDPNTTSTYSYIWQNVPVSADGVLVQAVDANGSFATDLKDITVKPQPIIVLIPPSAPTTPSSPVKPVVTLTSPASGNIFSPGSTVTITANASESDGKIVKVLFYSNKDLLKTSTAPDLKTTSTYSYSWVVPVGGIYYLSVQAEDENGNYNGKDTTGLTKITVTSSS